MSTFTSASGKPSSSSGTPTGPKSTPGKSSSTSRCSEAVLVSACLLGVRCRYDGGASPSPEALAARGEGRRLILVCPEVLGGLPVPRPRAEVRGGDGRDVWAGRARVMAETGEEVTEAFLRGAEEAWRRGERAGAREAWLKARSPSCGVRCLYDGSFTRKLRAGPGVLAALLEEKGWKLREL